MKKVGLLIRLENRISEVIEKADNLNLPTFQSFLVNNSGKYIKLTEEDARNFVKLRKKYNNIFLHSSFWINLASNKSYNLRLNTGSVLDALRLIQPFSDSTLIPSIVIIL